MISFRREGSASAALLLALAGLAPAEVQLDSYARSVREFSLVNGLKVVLLEDHGAPLVTACITAQGGYASDPKGLRGLAAMMPSSLEEGPEQLGSRNLAEERAALKAMNAARAEWKALELKPGSSALYDRMQAEAKLKLATSRAESLAKPGFSIRALEYYGAQNFQAAVNADFLQWSVQLPSNRADAFLMLYGEWLRAPFPRMVARIRERKLQELTQRRTTQDYLIRRALLGLAFGAGGYGLLDVEQAETERIQHSDVESYMKARLGASNLVLTLAGDLTEETARALAEKYMGKIPTGTPFKPESAPAPTAKELRAAPPREMQGAIIVGYRRPPDSSPDDPVMDVIEEMMLEGPNSRWRKEFLAAYPMLAGMVPMASLPGSREGGLMAILMPHHPARTPQEWVNLLCKFFEDLSVTPPSDDVLAQARRAIENRLLNQLADPNLAVRYIGRMGGWTQVVALANGWAGVTPDEVRRVAGAYLRPEGRVILQPGYVATSSTAGGAQ